MFDAMCQLFGIFGIQLTQQYVEQLTFAQLVPLILVSTLAFCIISAILKSMLKIMYMIFGGFGTR